MAAAPEPRTKASLTLSRTQKAAVILVAMGKPAASRLLKFFKQDELKSLIEAARVLRTVPQSELERIVGEFEVEFTEGAGVMDSADEMDTLLNETLSPEEMTALMGERVSAPATSASPSVWAEIDKLPSERIAGLLNGEHPQTAAVILSNLAPGVGASALLAVDKGARGEIVKRMMATATVAPTALRIVEDALRRKLKAESAAKNSSAAQARVASMLNEMDKSALDDVMQDLEAAGAPDLAAIRAQLFSFEDVALLTQKARVALFDNLSSELITLALRNTELNLAEAVLSSIGARSRRMIEAELAQGSDNVSVSDIARARRTVASAAVRMAGEGAFALPSAQLAA